MPRHAAMGADMDKQIGNGVMSATAMSISRATRWLARRGNRFLASRRGSTAIIFGLAAIPMLIAAGCAIDLSRALIVRQRLGQALDAAGLAVARDVTATTQTQMQQIVDVFFAANYPNTELGVPSAVTVTPTSNGVKLAATADVDTAIMRIVGLDKLTVNVANEVVRATTRLRVALALDTTKSMDDDGKLPALITATKSLLTQLKNVGTNPGDVYVSIIPFSKDINIGASNYNASWIDWTAWNAANQTCSGPWWNQTCTPNNHNTWNGCIMDRGTNTAPGATVGYDQKVDAPVVGNPPTLYPADQYTHVGYACAKQLMALNDNWSTMNTLVDSFVAAGSTNQPIGLVWAWLSLAGNSPLTAPAKDPNFQYYDVIVLMSDGLNTQDRWYNFQMPSNSSVDARMYNGGGSSGTCKNVKDDGVVIYAVQVDTGSDGVSTLLQNCASDSTKYFHLTSANQLITTFNQIATELSQLRLAK